MIALDPQNCGHSTHSFSRCAREGISVTLTFLFHEQNSLKHSDEQYRGSCAAAATANWQFRSFKSAVVILPICSGIDFSELLVQFGILKPANPRSGSLGARSTQVRRQSSVLCVCHRIFFALHSRAYGSTGCMFKSASGDRSDARQAAHRSFRIEMLW